MIKKLACLVDFTRLPKSVWRNRSLLGQLIKRNLAMRYRGSMLGFFWSFVQPLMMLCVYTFVFSVVFQARWGVEIGGRGAFAIIMLCGLALYNIFAESTNYCCGVITSNPNFVKKVIFPLEILPLAQTVSSFILGLVWFVLLFLGVIFIYREISFTMLLLPLILLPLFFFTVGVGYFVASLGVYLRDTTYIVQVVLQILLFMTPIFYPLEAVPVEYRAPLEANPLTLLIEQARRVFLYGQLPNWYFLGIAAVASLIILHLGSVWFFKTKKGFADVL